MSTTPLQKSFSLRDYGWLAGSCGRTCMHDTPERSVEDLHSSLAEGHAQCSTEEVAKLPGKVVHARSGVQQINGS